MKDKHFLYDEKKGTEDRYYGSDLNKFIACNCRKDMVVNNMDLIIHDYKNKIITIIESKNRREAIKTGQKLLLKKLREILPKKYKDYKTQVLVAIGNYPYEEIILENVEGKVVMKLNQKELIKFINNEL
jgi:hypothetical protein